MFRQLDRLPEGKHRSRVPCVLSAGERWAECGHSPSQFLGRAGLTLIRAVSVQTRHCMREITWNYVENRVTWHLIYLFIYSHAYLFWCIHLSRRVTPSRVVLRVTTSVSGTPNLTAGPSVSSFPSVGVCARVCPYSSHSNPSIWLSVSLCPAHGRHCWGHAGWCTLSDDLKSGHSVRLQPLKHILLLWNLPLIISGHFSLGGDGAHSYIVRDLGFVFLLGRLFFADADLPSRVSLQSDCSVSHAAKPLSVTETS